MALEMLTLRQQLAVLKRPMRKPMLKFRDRLFWVTVSRIKMGRCAYHRTTDHSNPVAQESFQVEIYVKRKMRNYRKLWMSM